MEVSVLGERPSRPLIVVSPVLVISVLAIIPNCAAVPRSICAKACSHKQDTTMRMAGRRRYVERIFAGGERRE